MAQEIFFSLFVVFLRIEFSAMSLGTIKHGTFITHKEKDIDINFQSYDHAHYITTLTHYNDVIAHDNMMYNIHLSILIKKTYFVIDSCHHGSHGVNANGLNCCVWFWYLGITL